MFEIIVWTFVSGVAGTSWGVVAERVKKCKCAWASEFLPKCSVETPTLTI